MYSLIRNICLVLLFKVDIFHAVVLLAIIKIVCSTKSQNLTDDKFEIEFEIEFENDEESNNPRQRRNCKICIML